MAERIAEDAAVLGGLGLEIVNLTFVEDQHRRREQDSGRLLSAILPHLDHSSTIYAPAGIGEQPDHMAVRAMAVELRRRGFTVTLYGELPYSNSFGWPHWMVGRDPDPFLDVTSDWRRALWGAELALEPENAVIERLSSEAQAEKLAAVREYRTQFSVLERDFHRGASHPESFSFEVFWPLEPTRQTRFESLRYDLFWRLGARRGSPLERLLRRRGLRSLRPQAGSRLGRLLRHRGRAS
jgi:LmbE family N-acetylglucosaminyl deacetylase